MGKKAQFLDWFEDFDQKKNNESVLEKNTKGNHFKSGDTSKPAFTGADLVYLGRLCSETGPINSSKKKFKISSIYTYFGQFIAHDMLNVSDAHLQPVGEFSSVMDRQNTIARPLTLSSIYKNRLGQSGNSGKFRNARDGAFTYDIPRSGCGEPDIPDKRNDQNLLIAQFHKLWLNYHNFLVDRQELSYEQAKHKVHDTYLHLIKYDFLKQMMFEPIWDLFFASPGLPPMVDLHTDNDTSLIPSPFHAAAFRIGHGMVRDRYRISAREKIKLEDMFGVTHNKDLGTADNNLNLLRITNNAPMRDKYRIDWKQFVKNRAFVPSGNVKIDVPHIQDNNVSLVTRNMRRAHDFGVADAQTYIHSYTENHPQLKDFFKRFSITSNFLFRDLPKVLETDTAEWDWKKLLNSTPLWFYIQREAAELHYLKTRNKHNFSEKRGVLGPLGSLIIGQVFWPYLASVPAGYGDISTITGLTRIREYSFNE